MSTQNTRTGDSTRTAEGFSEVASSTRWPVSTL